MFFARHTLPLLLLLLLPLLAACGVPDRQVASTTPIIRVVSTPVEQPLALPTPSDPAIAIGEAPPAPTNPAAQATKVLPTSEGTKKPQPTTPARTAIANAGATPAAPLAPVAPASQPADAAPEAPAADAPPVDGAPVADPAAEEQQPVAPEGQPAPAPENPPPPPAPVAAEPGSGPGGLPYPLTLPALEFGAVQHLYWTDRSVPLERTRQAGIGWVRQQIHWRDIEDQSGAYFWADLDGIVADVNAYGLKLLINVTRSPGWFTANGGDGLPQDPATLGRFVGALAERYKGRVQAIMIWNEQNLAYENGGEVSEADAGHFVEIMAACYGAIKAVDPSILVVTGAPASTATNIPSIALSSERYYRAMYSYNDGAIRNFFDIQAIHPGGSANPPETLWPDNPSTAAGWNDDATFYFRNVENVRKIMEEYGLGNHQAWITEFGWATANTTPGYEFGNQTSLEQQREYIVGAMRYTADTYPWVSNMFLWNMNFAMLRAQSGDPTHEQASFAILNADGSPRPAWYGVQEFIGNR